MKRTRIILIVVAATALAPLFCGGCRQQMADQPAYRPLAPSRLFPDGMSARRPPAGAVAQGQLHLDSRFYRGTQRPVPDDRFMAALVPAQGTARVEPSPEQIAQIPYVEQIPLNVDDAVLARGRTLYSVFCAVCHGPRGKGDGPVIERGFTVPSDYHTDRLRQAPVGYYFDVITHGLGPMPNYRHQIPPRDRWAIIAHVRAIQRVGHETRSHNGRPSTDEAFKETLERSIAR